MKATETNGGVADAARVWTQMSKEAADNFARATEMGLDASRALMQSWVRAPSAGGNGRSTAPFAHAGDAWMRAMAEASRRTQDAVQKGQVLTPDLYADVWTRAAGEIAQEIVEDPAFARITGNVVNASMVNREEFATRSAQRARDIGIAAHEDVVEVGRRLVELERRVHELTWLIRDGPAKSGARAPGKPAGKSKASGKKRTRAKESSK